MGFVAEVSSNHHRDLQRCLDFIDTAAAIGCSAVKFQLFKIGELFAPEILDNSEKHRRRKNWELPVNFSVKGVSDSSPFSKSSETEAQQCRIVVP